ncbi:MAG TPA: nitrogenase cofactor biosynthesis protein NifB, partial [Lachnospiraceae bacterium]|nr:nitrogenase cofactor biosynthesis protein NifB [Lachnospiraceae bacterium]
CKSLQGKIEDGIRKVAKSYFIDSYRILDDTDFKTIEREAVALGANLLIGNSDGRRMEERLGIRLVRRGFPIHDRVGGQRLRMYGYEGSLTVLDDISNALLARKETGFREELYRRYYLREEEGRDTVEIESCNKADKKEVEKEGIVIDTTVPTIEEKTKTHPCYNCGASDYARMHLPIAPKCNIQCNYCVRKFDCPNESRPGVTTTVLNPEEAFEKFKEVKEKVPKLSVVGIAGPGDALANFENTKRTLELIREYDPNITFCLSTNGLMLPTYAHELINLGVSHVTVTMNAVDPKIGAKIYKHVRYMGMTYTGEAAAAILLANQLSGLRILTSHGIICKVNIVMLKGINDLHIPEVVKMVKELGGTITNIMQLIPVKGSAFEDMPLVSNIEIMDMRKKCGETMKQMYHCKQCRADAIGTLENDRSIEFNGCGSGCKSDEKEIAALAKEFIDHRKSIKFAIASKGGMLIDQHFGQVSELYIYEYRNGEAIFKEKRNIKKYCEGITKCEEKEDKMSLIVSSISDCDGVIAMRIGDSPTQKLNSKGIQVYTTYDRIEDAVRNAAKELFQC